MMVNESRDAVVALLAEGVDRNLWFWGMKNADEVALLAEGVDRNFTALPKLSASRRRPPRGGRG